MTDIRSAGSGRLGVASALVRTIASPRAALVLTSDAVVPGDWPRVGGEIEANLSHVVGWSCEVRKDVAILMNPLGEGLVKAPVPQLSAAWLDNARHDASCAVFLAPTAAEAGFAELTVAAAASLELWAGTVRTAVANDYGAMEPVGRNQPCPCGSGKKYKHCHG